MNIHGTLIFLTYSEHLMYVHFACSVQKGTCLLVPVGKYLFKVNNKEMTMARFF